MMIKYFLLPLILLSSSAMAGVSIQTSKDGHTTTIHANNETVGSVLKYFNKYYNTTSTLPVSLSKDKINATVAGKNLMAATQKLFRAYSLGLVADKDHEISHISILPTDRLSETAETLQIGKVNDRDTASYLHMRSRIGHGFGHYSTGRKAWSAPQGHSRFHYAGRRARPHPLTPEKRKWRREQLQRHRR